MKIIVLAPDKLIDLTIVKEINYQDMNEDFENACRQIADREKAKWTKALLAGIKYQPQIDDIEPLLEQWAVYTYAKLLASEIFLPITTEEKSFVYAPFQCMAQYFLQKDYCGIVYSSTVFPEGKNVVLFDKSIAYPYGEIRHLTIPLPPEAIATSTII